MAAVAILALPTVARAAPSLATLDDFTRGHVNPAATLFALGAVALSLLLAFLGERLSAPPPDAGETPRLPDGSREVELFGLKYGVSLENGRLDAGGRRRRSLTTPTGRVISWRSPARDFPADPSRPLTILAAGGRAIASVDGATRRVAFHEADLGRLHGLGRRGRALILWPLFLATTAFAVLMHRALGTYLKPGAGGVPDAYLGFSVLVLSAYFAIVLFVVLATNVAVLSAVFRRVRRVQLRRRYESAWHAFLTSLAAPTLTAAASGARRSDEPPFEL